MGIGLGVSWGVGAGVSSGDGWSQSQWRSQCRHACTVHMCARALSDQKNHIQEQSNTLDGTY